MLGPLFDEQLKVVGKIHLHDVAVCHDKAVGELVKFSASI